MKSAAAKSLQSCPTLCDSRDGSPPGFPVPGILQARTLEWVAISFPNASKWKMKVKPLSRVRLFSTPWAAAYQAPLSIGFSRQEYWSGVPSPFPFPTGILIRSVILRATNCTEKIKYNWTGCLSFAWFVQRGFASHNFGNSSVTTDFCHTDMNSSSKILLCLDFSKRQFNRNWILEFKQTGI